MRAYDVFEQINARLAERAAAVPLDDSGHLEVDLLFGDARAKDGPDELRNQAGI